MSDEGDRTIRQHIGEFLDNGTFREIGTFSRSIRTEEREKTPGDGKIGGHGMVNGRPVAVFGDDITVYRGSSSIVGTLCCRFASSNKPPGSLIPSAPIVSGIRAPPVSPK